MYYFGMARPVRLEAEGALYHVIVRGNERKAVFRDDVDREEYLGRLARYREEFGFQLFAYCLMTNHVHLAIRRGPAALSRIMHVLQSSYTQRFNRRHNRVGHLFQGRYKAFLVQKERYMLALVRYIHENPLRAGIVTRAQDYAWSSDRYYRSGSGPGYLDLDEVLRMLGRSRSDAVARYKRLMRDESAPRYEDLEAQGGVVRGDDEFADRLLTENDRPVESRRFWSAEKLARAVAKEHGFSLADLKNPSRARATSRARILTAYLGRRDARIPVARLARLFGRDESTLLRGVLLFERELRRDRKMSSETEALGERLRLGNNT